MLPLSPDELCCVLGFLRGAQVLHVRRVSRAMAEAVGRLCWRGPARAARIPMLDDTFHTTDRLAGAMVTAGGAPLWLRLIDWEPSRLLAHCAQYGLLSAIGALAEPPFSFGFADARAPDPDRGALSLAVAYGHLAVVERLTQEPFCFGQDDARAGIGALTFACGNGHVRVIERLGLPPFSLAGGNNGEIVMALRAVTPKDREAVVECVAAPPFSLARAVAELFTAKPAVSQLSRRRRR